MTSIEKWHLKKEISFGNLLTSIISIAALAAWLFTLQGRVSILEARQTTLETTIISRLDTIANRQYDHLSGQHVNKGNGP